MNEQTDYKHALQKALNLLSRRDYTRAELIEKLRAVATPEAAEQAVSRLEELGYIDDARVAALYYDAYINVKKLSPKSARYELQRKGIPPEIIEAVAAERKVDEAAQICALIAQKYKNSLVNSAGAADEKDARRVFAALARKGYAFADIRAAMREYIELNDENCHPE